VNIVQHEVNGLKSTFYVENTELFNLMFSSYWNITTLKK